jgi:predicted trehalose synthase
MNLIKYLSKQRWFMGKNRTISHVETLDSTEAGTTRIKLIKVTFMDGESDIYTIIDDENAVGKILEDAFLDGSQQSVFSGDKGFFSFRITAPLPKASLASVKPVSKEQSNSAFCAPGKFFFKLYRRLQPGLHPEAEILEAMNKADSSRVPRLYAVCNYKSNAGEIYTWGILEEHFADAKDAWNEFCNDMSSTDAFQLGMSTAQMHESFKKLGGPMYSSDEPPFERLAQLLQSTKDTKYAPQLRERLPQLQIRYYDLLRETFSDKTFKRQRIHGDYHLGQVLITQSANGTKHFEIIDFEGEPTRSLDYRRTCRSPAVDIAGMLRSFAYAGAVAKTDPTDAELAFITGYSKVSGVSADAIEKTAKPYILAKAIYEACYELEFRPDWFWIPAQALLAL